MKKLITLILIVCSASAFGQTPFTIRGELRQVYKTGSANDTVRQFLQGDSVNIKTSKAIFNYNKKIKAPLFLIGPDTASTKAYVRSLIGVETDPVWTLAQPYYVTRVELEDTAEAIRASGGGSGITTAQLYQAINDTAITYKEYYVSNNGSDANAGTINAPFATIGAAWALTKPGDIIWVRGGTYTIASIPGDQYVNLSGRRGKIGKHIKIWNYPGENPIFDASTCAPSNYKAIFNISSSSYIHIRGLRFTGLAQYNSGLGYGGNYAFVGQNLSNSIIENCEFDHMGGAGFQIWDVGSSNNLILNCDSHHNADPYSSDAWSNANGFNITPSGGTNNTFRGCRAWMNSDDGFDLYGYAGVAIFENCWAFWNGFIPEEGVPVNYTGVGDGHGFKLGGSSDASPTVVKTFVTNCIAVHNREIGFSQNGATHAHSIKNCIAYNNPTHPFHTSVNYLGTPYSNVYQNNWYKGGVLAINSASVNSYNSWNLSLTIDPLTDLESNDSTQLLRGRNEKDNSLPYLTFLKPSSTGQLVNAGVYVGLPYASTAPDLGAFEVWPNYSGASVDTSLFVHKAGSQVITGSKTFSGGLELTRDTTQTQPTSAMTEQQVKREIAAVDGGWKKRVGATVYVFEEGNDSVVINDTNGETSASLSLYSDGERKSYINDSGTGYFGGMYVFGTAIYNDYFMIRPDGSLFNIGKKYGALNTGLFMDDDDTIKWGRYQNATSVNQGDYFYSTKSGTIGIVSNGVKTFEVDSNGMIKNAFTPHAQSVFMDSTITINLTQNVWTQITRPVAKTTWPTTEFYGFTDSGDTISAQYSGHYIARYDINITELDNKTYEYRLMQKNGSTIEKWRYTVSGTGTIVLRNISSYMDLEANSKFWVEIRCTSLAPGSVTIYGGRMTVTPVHLNLN